MAVLWSGGGDGWRDLPAVAMPVQSKSERRRDEQLRAIATMAVATGVSPMPVDEELEWLREQDRAIEPMDPCSNHTIQRRTGSVGRMKAPGKKPDGYKPILARTGKHLFEDTGWKRIDRRDR